jgi:hypothetical protein
VTDYSDADIARFRETVEREMAEAMATVLEPNKIRERLERSDREVAELGWPAYVKKMQRETQAKVGKKERKTRAPSPKTIASRIDAIRKTGHHVTSVGPDGTMTIVGGIVSRNTTQDDPEELRRVL